MTKHNNKITSIAALRLHFKIMVKKHIKLLLRTCRILGNKANRLIMDY